MPQDPIIIAGDEQSRIIPDLADFGLPPAIGVHSVQIFRASRDVPEICDQFGWTYHHHVDMACWKGRLYVGWNSCERDEDVWPSRELYSTSVDGVNWTNPQELFPQGVSTCLRMYFFLAPNGKMLAIAGMRTDLADTDEDKKGGLVVREISADHQLGPVYTLQHQPVPPGAPPFFAESSDVAFIAACNALLADTTYLEQQDRGRLLGDRRMKWHDAAAWDRTSVPGDDEKWVCGKAYSFYRRDNQLVGVSKMGWTTTSDDNGLTWSKPVVPASLITGKAKVWCQQTADGRYALVYNPSTRTRFPLIVVTSDDGITFRNMRIVQGELPVQRYAGKFRSIGPQYVRGISHWANDGSRNEQCMWLTYSMSKEDLWVSRVPLPVKAEATTINAPWNIYQPKWSSANEKDGVLSLSCRDPYDYASATRVLRESASQSIQLTLRITHQSQPIEIDALSKFGSKRLIQLRFDRDDVSVKMHLSAPSSVSPELVQQVASYKMNEWFTITFPRIAEQIHRITIRTGPYRNVGGQNPVAPGTDKPVEPTTIEIQQPKVN